MIHSSFLSFKSQFHIHIHIYHNSLLICYKNLLIVKVFSIDPFGGAKACLLRQGTEAPLPSTSSGH
jgi:hypothetical protein